MFYPQEDTLTHSFNHTDRYIDKHEHTNTTVGAHSHAVSTNISKTYRTAETVIFIYIELSKGDVGLKHVHTRSVYKDYRPDRKDSQHLSVV